MAVFEDKFGTYQTYKTSIRLANSLKSNLFSKAISIIFFGPTLGCAQDIWQFNSAFNVTTGHYIGSLTMNDQQGLGFRISGEQEHRWGFTTGLQTTRIDMNPITQTSVQRQDNWMASAHINEPFQTSSGNWVLQIDTHKIDNDASYTNSRYVRAIAPQIIWLSPTQPLKIDFSFANSNYINTRPIHQLSSAIAYGFNNGTDWLQIRTYSINNLTPSEALGLSNTHAVEVKFTYVLDRTAFTVGLDSGKRVYWVDMTSQTVYNQSMINEGGGNIAITWLLHPKSSISLQLNQTQYYSESVTAHRFKLSTLSTLLSFGW